MESYVRYDHLDFTIDYEFNGSQHSNIPDFLVKLKNGTNLILEVKGFEDEQARAKHEAGVAKIEDQRYPFSQRNCSINLWNR